MEHVGALVWREPPNQAAALSRISKQNAEVSKFWAGMGREPAMGDGTACAPENGMYQMLQHFARAAD